MVKDKIVIIGYLGNNLDHQPSKFFDDRDVHPAPKGDMYGVSIIASDTLLGHRINALGKRATFVVAIFLMLATFFGIIFIKIQSKLLIIFIGNLLMIFQLFVYSFGFVWVFIEYDFFVSIEQISVAVFSSAQAGIIYKLAR